MCSSLFVNKEVSSFAAFWDESIIFLNLFMNVWKESPVTSMGVLNLLAVNNEMSISVNWSKEDEN